MKILKRRVEGDETHGRGWEEGWSVDARDLDTGHELLDREGCNACGHGYRVLETVRRPLA